MPRRTVLALSLLAAACGHRADPVDLSPTASAAPSATAAAAVEKPPARVLVDLVAALPSCDVDHRGPLLDTGTEAMVGRYGWARGIPAGVASVEHDGSTWARFTDRRVQVAFTLLAPSPVFVAARGVGYGAKSASVLLDDQPLGTLPFHREQIRVGQTGTTNLPVDPGIHTLTLRFSGRVRDGDAFADVDWIRVGVPDESGAVYGPPTLRDTLAPTAAFAGVPHRSLAVHAPGAIRCPLRFPRGGRLRTAVGLQGTGEGEAEVRIVRDGKKPEVLRTVHLEGGEKARWVDIEVPLDDAASTIGALELAATAAPKGGRVLFGDPAIVLPPATSAPPPPARAVVILVLDGVSRADLPPWNGSPPATLPALGELAEASAVFDRHRASTTMVVASMASLLSGLPPTAHGMSDPGARLPASLPTVATLTRDAGVRTGMFTGVPYSFRAFGFGAGWERFVEHPPQSGAPATAPIDDATAWITDLAKGPADTRAFLLVHARGGHPPWDVTPKELAAAPPAEYGGLVEPRKAPQTLARMRRSKRAKIVTDADRQRIHALTALGLAGQDRAVAGMVTALKAAGLWDSTLFIVTGDVGSGADELFGDGVDLKEPALSLPLYAHFPGGLAAGRRIEEPTEVVDLARTALSAFGLAPVRPSSPPAGGAPEAPRDKATLARAFGKDLARLAADLDVAANLPQVAVLDNRYSARWGDLVLSGKFFAPPSLCDLGLDATCAFNRRDAMPVAAGAIFRSLVVQDLALRAIAEKREPASVDPDTAAAMRVWGAMD